MTAVQAKARGGPSDPSHDADLRRGILHTSVSRPVAAALVAIFLVTIAAVPIGQAVIERVKGDDSVLPDLFRHVPTRETIKAFEEDLDKASYVREWIRPRVQLLLTRFGGYGNTKAVLGSKPGWLFYQPGIAAVGGPGLLNTRIMAARTKSALDEGSGSLHPDPRPAILAFQRFLAMRGIVLVLFAVPDKAGLQPAELHGRRADGHAAVPRGENLDQPRLMDQLVEAGVVVFDPAPRVLVPGTPSLFLEQDTHWTPAWMESVAGQLATFIVQRRLLPPVPSSNRHPGWHTIARQVSRLGDIVDMLALPDDQTLYAPQTVTVNEVHAPARGHAAAGVGAGDAPSADDAGELFAPDPHADVLLLGDSFTNVFTLAAMGWGESAGFAPHLAVALDCAVDVIAQNDSGAYATRKLLAEALGGGDDRLAGKRVVIWELASRELAVGDWRPIAWPTSTPAAAAGAKDRAP